jgi:hypothetical protein
MDIHILRDNFMLKGIILVNNYKCLGISTEEGKIEIETKKTHSLQDFKKISNRLIKKYLKILTKE